MLSDILCPLSLFCDTATETNKNYVKVVLTLILCTFLYLTRNNEISIPSL